MRPGETIEACLRRVLGAVSRDVVSYDWLRRQVADPSVSASDLTAAARALGWRQSFRCQPDGRPRHYWRDWAERPSLSIEQRDALAATPYVPGEPRDVTLARAAAKRALPPVMLDPMLETRAALAALGPYVPGEPQARSRQRAALKRALKPPPGQQRPTEPLPTSLESARSELAALAPWAWGEPMSVSRRRAALRRIVARLSSDLADRL